MAPAIVNWINNNNTCKTKMTMITLRNIVIILMTCPLTVMFKKIPKIWSGNSGMITTSISLMIISLKSVKESRRVVPAILESPRPIVKDSSKAVMTSIKGGIFTTK